MKKKSLIYLVVCLSILGVFTLTAFSFNKDDLNKTPAEIENTINKAYNIYRSSKQNATNNLVEYLKVEYPEAANLISEIQTSKSDESTTIINKSAVSDRIYFSDFEQNESGFRQWIASASKGKTLIGNGATINITDAIDLRLDDNVTIDFKDMTITGAIDINKRVYVKSEPAWLSTSATLKSSTNQGDFTIKVSDPRQFNVGDFIYLKSKSVYAGTTSHADKPSLSYLYKKSEMAKITKKSGDTLTLNRPLYYSNNYIDVALWKQTPRQNVKIKNLNIHVTQNKTALVISFLENFEITGVNITAENHGYNGMVIKNSLKGDIHHNEVSDFNNNYTNIGYGLFVSGNNIDVHHNIVVRSRHDITSGDRGMLSTNLIIRNNFTGLSYGKSNDFGSIDFHNNVTDSKIINNIIWGAMGGINLRNNGATNVKGNHIVASYGGAIYVYTIEYYVEGQYTYKDVNISGNKIIDCGYGSKRSAIAVYNSAKTGAQLPLANFIIEGNTFKGGEATQSYAIAFPSDAVASKYKNVVIRNNLFDKVPNMILNPQGMLIENNIFKGTSKSYSFIISRNSKMEKVLLTGNKYYNAGSSTAIKFDSGTNKNVVKNETFIDFRRKPINNSIGATIGKNSHL